MKDYYYILGLESTATISEIKSAYRKLSKKFHPDLNQGDSFFEKRFKEINEAYEILSNTSSKIIYDRKRNSNYRQSNTVKERPYIIYFKTNKTTYNVNEEVQFSWYAKNATSCIINIFGSVEQKGEKLVRFNKMNKDLKVILFAKNSEGEEQQEVLISILSEAESATEKDLHPRKGETTRKENNNHTLYIFILFTIITILSVGILWFNNKILVHKQESSEGITSQNEPKNHIKNESKYIPYKIEKGVNKIKQYYWSFENKNELSSNIQFFYNPIIMDYHGRKYVNSFEAKNSDIDDFIKNNVKSYKIKIDESNLNYEEFEYYYLYRTILDYTILKNNGDKVEQKFNINIALTKDEYKIIAISNHLDPSKIDKLISEEVEANLDERLYYEKGIKDKNIQAIRNLINDYNTNNLGVNVDLDGDIGSMMGKFDDDYFQSKFMLVAIEDAKYGGKWATILFIDKPDRGFFVWVYNGRIKGFGDAELKSELLSIIQTDLISFDKSYGF